jgi:hypothetical protein
MENVTKTANLLDELLASHPTAIRHNAVKLGLLREGDPLTRQTLLQAVVEKQKRDNLSNDATIALMCELLSVENAKNSVIRSLYGQNTEGGQNYSIHGYGYGAYLLGFFALLGFFCCLIAVGRGIKKIIT